MSPLAHKIIRASAGTGKTFQLTNRYLHLLAAGSEPRGILATTFTRKAAGEILARLFQRLCQAAESDAGAATLAQHLAAERKGERGGQALSRADCRAILHRLCDSLHQVNIQTLDSFFSRLAACFRLELALPAHAQMVGEDDALAVQLRQRALDDLLLASDLPTLLKLLQQLHHDDARRRVWEALDDILRDLYATYRLAPAENCWNHIGPELAKRPRCMDDEELGELAGQIAASLETSKPNGQLAKAVLKDLGLLAERNWKELLKGRLLQAVRNDGEYATFSRKPVPQPFLGYYQTIGGQAEAHLLFHLHEQTRALYSLLSRFDEHYIQLRLRQRVLLFSDLPERLAGQLPDLSPDLHSEIYYRLDGQIAHLLLDEFQDTSPQQWQVLLPLAQEITAHGPADQSGRSFFCVGDTKQAIYNWRGGCAAIFDHLLRDLALPQDSQSGLQRSYRSSQVILDVVNRVFCGLASIAALSKFPEPCALWDARFQTHEANQRNLPGFVSIEMTARAPTAAEDAAAKENAAGNERGADGADDAGGEQNGEEEDEATPDVQRHLMHVARKIIELGEQMPGRSIGVLTSTNGSARLLLALLRRQGLTRVSGEGGGSLGDDPAVSVVLSALTLADHPGNLAAAFHVQQSPLAKMLGLTQTTAGARESAGRSIREQISHEGCAAVVSRWAGALAPFADRSQALRLLQLVELTDQYESQRTLRASDLVRFVAASMVEAPESAQVRVMTIHKAKGLEFDAVVLPELTRQLFGGPPAIFTLRDDPAGPLTAVFASAGKHVCVLLPELDEASRQHQEQRLSDSLCSLYVAMTRARQGLYVMLQPPKLTTKNALRKRQLCFASILEEALELEAPNVREAVRLFQHGDERWWEEGEKKDPQEKRDAGQAADKTAAAGPSLPVRLQMAATVDAQRSWRRVAPSSLEGGGRVQVADLLSLAPPAGRLRGSVLHALFQQVTFVGPGPDDQTLPADAELAELAAQAAPAADAALIAQQVQTFRRMLEQPDLQLALARPEQEAGVTVELWRERPFVVHDQGNLLSGAFDRVLVFRRGDKALRAELLDFKTDQITAGQINSSSEHYRGQIQAYRRALARMLGLEDAAVRCRLAFVGLGRVVDVD